MSQTIWNAGGIQGGYRCQNCGRYVNSAVSQEVVLSLQLRLCEVIEILWPSEQAKAPVVLCFLVVCGEHFKENYRLFRGMVTSVAMWIDRAKTAAALTVRVLFRLWSGKELRPLDIEFPRCLGRDELHRQGRLWRSLSWSLESDSTLIELDAWGDELYTDGWLSATVVDNSSLLRTW